MYSEYSKHAAVHTPIFSFIRRSVYIFNAPSRSRFNLAAIAVVTANEQIT